MLRKRFSEVCSFAKGEFVVHIRRGVYRIISAFAHSSLTDQSKKEIADMSARLYLNLGVTYECKEDYGEAIKYLEMAMSVCRHNDFWELLHQCYATTGLLYTNKMDDNTKALRFFSLAINTAERLSTNRTIRVCQTLQSKAEVQIKMADFQGAKQVLHKAYKMKTSDVSDRQAIEKTLKIGKSHLQPFRCESLIHFRFRFSCGHLLCGEPGDQNRIGGLWTKEAIVRDHGRRGMSIEELYGGHWLLRENA